MTQRHPTPPVGQPPTPGPYGPYVVPMAGNRAKGAGLGSPSQARYRHEEGDNMTT